MSKRKIPLVQGAETDTVLTAVRTAVERKGYHWEPVGHASAEAHEGGRQVKSKLFTVRLAMGAEIEDSVLVLRTLSSGLGLVGATGHPAAMVMIGGKFRRLTKEVKAELRSRELME